MSNSFTALHQFTHATSLKPKLYNEYKLNSKMIHGKILFKGDFYQPQEYYDHLEKLCTAFSEEKKSFIWNLTNTPSKIDYLEHLIETLDSSTARGPQYNHPEIKKFEKEYDYLVKVNYDVQVTIQNKIPTLIIDNHTLKEIEETFGPFEKYQTYRTFCLFHVSKSFIDASIGIIKEEKKLLETQQKKKTETPLSKETPLPNQKTPENSKLCEPRVIYETSNPNSTVKASTAPKVLRFRMPSNLPQERVAQIENAQRFALLDLHSFLVKNDFIKEKSRVEGFLNIFFGDRVKVNEKIRWKSAQVELRVFIDMIEDYLEFDGREKWLMVSRCFAKNDSSHLDGRKVAKSDKSEMKSNRYKILNDYFKKNFQNKAHFFPKHNPK